MPRKSVVTRPVRIASYALLLFLVVVSTGCGSPDDEPTITERQRRAAGPKVGDFIINAQRAFEQGAYNLALVLTDSAEYYAPDLADLHFLRGSIYQQLNQLQIAEAAYKVVMGLDPEYQGARFNLGLIAFRQGRLRDAINWFQQEEELQTTSGLELELGRAYAKLGEPDSARMAYEHAIKLDSTNSTALMWLGQLYEELGEMDEALEWSRKGLSLRPNDRDYQYIVGSLLYRMGRIDSAEVYLRPVAAELLWHHGAQFNMGQVLMRLGKEEEARRYFAQADSAQQLQQEIAEAEKDIGREPRVLSHWVRIGMLLRKAGELEKAIDAFQVAAALAPENMHLQNNLALLYMENGQLDIAIRRYRAILTLDSTLADVWLNLGAAYANAGNTEAARDAWRKVQEIEPGHPVARDYLTQISETKHTP